jgi:hypothetical protein
MLRAEGKEITILTLSRPLASASVGKSLSSRNFRFTGEGAGLDIPRCGFSKRSSGRRAGRCDH